MNWLGFEVRHFAALNLLLGAVWVAVAVQLGKRYSARTTTLVQPPRIVAALVCRVLRVFALVPRAVLLRGGAAAGIALFVGIAAMTRSTAADAGVLEQVSTPGAFAAAGGLCEAWPGQKNTPPEHRYPLVRGSQMTDEGLAARSQKAALVLLSCALSVSAPSFSQERDAAIVVLEDGIAVTRLQRANEPLHYLIDALRGQTLLLEVEQRGLDVVVSVESPVGEIRRFNSPLFRDESELVLIEDSYAGRYRLTVVSEEPTNAVGEHAVSFRSLGADADARYVTALRHMSDGARANAESRGDDALQHYESAAQLWRDLGDTRRQAQAQYSEAMVLYWSVYDWSGAAERAAVAATLYEQLDARDLYANAMLVTGYSLMEVAQNAGMEGQRVFDDALAALRESFTVHKALGNDYELALVENFTGLAYHNRHTEAQDDLEAEKRFRHAAELFAGLGEWREELTARHNLALIGLDDGQAASAALALEEIVADIPPGKAPEIRATALANLGIAYRDSGNFEAALVVLSEAVQIHASLNQFNFEAFALRVLGSTYQALGELERADNTSAKRSKNRLMTETCAPP